MQIIETMTLNEVTARMRELGVKTSETRIAEAIQRGLYPWAIAIQGRKNMCYEIYTKLFDAWVAERSIDLPDEPCVFSLHQEGA
ncbi:MAG: hypothetical protein KHW76_08855 [Oscillibacter sp.]|nr:hypothetical protein [Oscillibacter sp.]